MQLRLLNAVERADSRSSVFRPQLHTAEPSSEPSSIPAGAHVRFWRPLPRKVLDVVCGEGVSGEVPFHAHEALQVLLPTTPFLVVRGAGRATVLRPGMVHLTSPGELRAARSLDGAPFGMRMMLVSPSVLTTPRPAQPLDSRRPASQTLDAGPSFAELVVEDGTLYAELMSVFDALRRPLVGPQCESRLRECLARLVAQGAERPASPPAAGVLRARDYLRVRAVQPVTLDELAKVARLSKFYLLRAFHRAYGLTPHAYQMQLRLARARRLLAEGRPLSHVTYDAGFADQSHLTRRFAAFYGLTPARFARQLATPPGAAPDLAASVSRTVTPPSAA